MAVLWDSHVVTPTTLWVAATALMVLFLMYPLGMFVGSRRTPRTAPAAPDDLFYVFLVPCLNEELVVATAIDRLLASEGENFAVMVIDDGSDDATADIVRARASDKVWLFERKAPNARKGKGAALNAAVAHLRTSGSLGGRHPDNVIVGIVDADGRLRADAMTKVSPYFGDPRTGGVQIGVRMYNADEGLLCRMQDYEFVTYTEIFQRSRHRIGSAGLGGNGQFTRLSTLNDLGDAPWNDCLTEDLDLGVRILSAGWGISFCATTWVSQQAVTSLRRLIRQRSRWFQGHLQTWRRLRTVVRGTLPARATMDLIHILLSPLLVLLMSLTAVMIVASISTFGAISPHTLKSDLLAYHGALIASVYVLSFGLTLPYAFVYWMRTPSAGFFRTIWWGHVYTVYGYMWFAAGWWAVFRTVRGRSGWQKTSRTVSVAVSDGESPGTTVPAEIVVPGLIPDAALPLVQGTSVAFSVASADTRFDASSFLPVKQSS